MLKRHQYRKVRRRDIPVSDLERETVEPAPIKRKNWREVFKRTKKAISEDNISIIAAGVAFYLLLGAVPALAALISIYGLVADPQQIEQQFSAVSGILPAQVTDLLLQQMKRIASNTSAAGVGAVIGILAALWSATAATKAVIKGLNIVYHEREKRGFFKLTFVTLTLTTGAVVLGITAVAAIVALPLILKFVAQVQISYGQFISNLIRWPLLAFVAVFGLTLLYRFGPSRIKPKWHWFSRGSLIAIILWVITSAAFSLYVAHFGKYNETYGSLGAVVILLMWLYLSAFVVLLGAEINAAHEGAKDA